MNIKRHISLIIFLLFNFFLFGQNAKVVVESLKGKHLNTEKVLIIINKELSDKSNLSDLDIAYYYEYKADLLKQNQNFYIVLDLYKKSLNIFNKKNKVKNEIILLNKISGVYIDIEDYSKAINYLEKVELYINSSDNLSNINSSRYLSNLAKMFFKTKEFDKAKKYYQRAFNYNILNEDLSLLHDQFLDYAKLNIAMKQLDSALFYCDEILNCKIVDKPHRLKAKSHILKGIIFEKESEFILAEKEYEKAIFIYRKIGNNTAPIYKKLGEFYDRIFLYDYAYKNYKIAIKKAKNEISISELQDLYHDLVENSLLQKKSKRAKYYLSKFDSIYEIREKDIQKRNLDYIAERYNIQQAEINYLNDRNTLIKKESELLIQKKIAKKNKLINIIIIILFLAIFLAAYVYYRYHKLNIEKSNAQLKNTVLRLQMNPHFIFNSLTAIQNSILKNDQLKSAELIAIFSKLIRQNLDFSNKKSISLTDEIDMLTNYLETQKFRFNDLFEFTINIDDEVDCDNTEIPPMLLQPFIENSIEHGLKHKKENGEIIINLKKIQKGVNITIIDNGIGREIAEIHNKNNDDKDKIHAIKIFKERLKIRQRNEIKEFIISDILDSNNKVKGTKVTFNIYD